MWGAISFHNLPVEAYPDVANNYVQVITQWPGRAAEEVEQQVTIPLEIVMAGIPHLDHLRSTSLFGLSSRDDDFRRPVAERLEPPEGAGAALAWRNCRPGSSRRSGPDYSPVGQIYWYTLRSTNPKYDLMELKTLEDWVLEKQFKSVPNVVDVSSFGGLTREYQVAVDPDKLVAYGLSIGQVEQQLANNNVNAGGSFVEAGLQQINVRALGLVRNVHDIENDRDQDAERHAGARQGHRHGGAGAEDPAGADRQGDPPGGWQDRGQQRRGGRHRAAAQGREFGRDARRHPRQGRGAERAHPAARASRSFRSSTAATWCTSPPTRCCTT